MRDETEHIVEQIEAEGRNHHRDGPVIDRVRSLWNWNRDQEDCNLELRVGNNSDLKGVLDAVEPDPDWVIRFFNTTDEVEMTVSVAMVYCGSMEVDGTIWFEDLFSDVDT